MHELLMRYALRIREAGGLAEISIYEQGYTLGHAPSPANGEGWDVDLMNHLLFMIGQTQDMTDACRTDRWLGFIQGCVWMLRLYDLDQLRAQTREVVDGRPGHTKDDDSGESYCRDCGLSEDHFECIPFCPATLVK